MVLGQHVASAQVVLGVDVASFDAIASLQRELGEEDEATMLDVLFRNLVTKKRYLFKQMSFSISFFQDIFSLLQALIFQNFIDRP